jgi:hypothetical protein
MSYGEESHVNGIQKSNNSLSEAIEPHPTEHNLKNELNSNAEENALLKLVI